MRIKGFLKYNSRRKNTYSQKTGDLQLINDLEIKYLNIWNKYASSRGKGPPEVIHPSTTSARKQQGWKMSVNPLEDTDETSGRQISSIIHTNY